MYHKIMNHDYNISFIIIMKYIENKTIKMVSLPNQHVIYVFYIIVFIYRTCLSNLYYIVL